MFLGTHALMPVCACMVADQLAIRSGRDRIFPALSMWAVGFFGALPDLCTPHVSLEDRYASWSHTVWFMAGMVVAVAMAGAMFEKGYRLRIAIACWIAAALHLAADAISGGIVWLYPWRSDVIGGFFVPVEHWIWFDAFFIILTWVMLRVIPQLEARNIRAASGTENS